MAKRHKLHLSDEQLQDLRHLRDTGEPAYLRERAAALLKITAGSSPHRIAQSGLLKRRKPDTVYTWLRHYREHRLWACDINPVKAENRLSLRCRRKTQNQNFKTLCVATRPCCPA